MKVRIAAVCAVSVGLLASGASAAGAAGETANRGDAAVAVNVELTGSGSGTVTSNSSTNPISCPADCFGTFQSASVVTLTATPAAGSVFAGFSGVTCMSVANPCAFNVGSGAFVTAVFNLLPPDDPDGDGVPDAADKCPSEAGPAFNDGCPVTTPPPDDTACDKAKAKLKKAKAKLAKLKADNAVEEKVDKAKAKVKKAKRAKKAACAA